MNYDNIEKDFVRRTLQIVSGYSGEYEVTMLLNCCLGLLVLPKEKHHNSIPDDILPVEGYLWGLSRAKVTVKCESCGYTLKNIMRRIRNSICHFRITVIADNLNQITSLVFKDTGGFKAELSVIELSELTRAFAEHVLQDC